MRLYHKVATRRIFCLPSVWLGIIFGCILSYILIILGSRRVENIFFPHRKLELVQPIIEPFETYNLWLNKTGADVYGQWIKPEDKVRVLCWIMTSPSNHKTRARYVKATWGRRCNVLLFMSSERDDDLPSIALPIQEGRYNLWYKTRAAFEYVYEHYLYEADWFMKADDDTYVIVENLRYMLSFYKPEVPVYFGAYFHCEGWKTFMHGGSGYVLSREAVKRLVEKALPDKDHCRPNPGKIMRGTGGEDVEIANCLEFAEVLAGDDRDSRGRNRFFPERLEEHIDPQKNLDRVHETKKGLESFSDTVISFHYISPNQMFWLEYLIYHLRLGVHGNRAFVTKGKHPGIVLRNLTKASN